MKVIMKQILQRQLRIAALFVCAISAAIVIASVKKLSAGVDDNGLRSGIDATGDCHERIPDNGNVFRKIESVTDIIGRIIFIRHQDNGKAYFLPILFYQLTEMRNVEPAAGAVGVEEV